MRSRGGGKPTSPGGEAWGRTSGLRRSASFGARESELSSGSVPGLGPCEWFLLGRLGAGGFVRSATVEDTEKTVRPPFPKIELHVHLEATVRPERLLEIARRNDFELPADTPEGSRDLSRSRSC